MQILAPMFQCFSHHFIQLVPAMSNELLSGFANHHNMIRKLESKYRKVNGTWIETKEKCSPLPGMTSYTSCCFCG